jgi:hypothetical protein
MKYSSPWMGDVCFPASFEPREPIAQSGDAIAGCRVRAFISATFALIQGDAVASF